MDGDDRMNSATRQLFFFFASLHLKHVVFCFTGCPTFLTESNAYKKMHPTPLISFISLMNSLQLLTLKKNTYNI